MVFDKAWFDRHQSKLLWFLNNALTGRVSRYLLGVHYQGIINRIEPNAFWYNAYKGKNEIEVTAQFYGKAFFGIALYKKFYLVWILMHVWDLLVSPKLNFGFDTLTKYPDADAETTSVDGYVANAPGAGTVWTTVRSATNGTFADDNSVIFAVQSSEASGSTNNFTIRRGFTLFDTSALTASATVSSATVSLYGSSITNGDNDGEDTINVFSSNPASNTGLATADYDQVGTTAFATAIDLGSISTAGYNDWSLNASGLSNISKTGVSKFGWKEGHDISGNAIANNSTNSVSFHSAENAGGTSQAPKLVITYTLPSTTKALAALGVG